MNVKIESLSYKAQRYYMEIVYSLEGINGRPATHKEILDYVLTTMCDIEEIVGDPVTFIGENKLPKDTTERTEQKTVQQHEWVDKGKIAGWLFKCSKCKCLKIADKPPILYTFGVGKSSYEEPPCREIQTDEK